MTPTLRRALLPTLMALLAPALALGPGVACRKADADQDRARKEAADRETERNRQQAERDRQRAEEAKSRQQAELTAQKIREVLQDVYFDYDQAQLTESGRKALKQAADYLKENPRLRIQVEGHADERGTNEYNLALGERRAATAAAYLTTLGVPADRLSTVSYGRERPVCPSHDEHCWHLNRRAHFEVKVAEAGETQVATIQ